MSTNQNFSPDKPAGEHTAAHVARIVAAVVVIGLGMLSLVFPVATGLSAAAVAPLFLIAAGLVGIGTELVAAFKSGVRFDWLIFLFSIVYLVLGSILSSNMFEAVYALSVVVAVGFLSQAMLAAIALFAAKGHRMWMLFLLICCLVLAYFSFSQWPFGAVQLAGISIGVNLISWGMALGWGNVRS